MSEKEIFKPMRVFLDCAVILMTPNKQFKRVTSKVFVFVKNTAKFGHFWGTKKNEKKKYAFFSIFFAFLSILEATTVIPDR